MNDENEDSNSAYPTNFQKRMFWSAITAMAIVIISAIGVGSIVLGGKILGYLQPILVPIAIAGIIAYLLEPIINFLRIKTRWKHKTCMYLVFTTFLALIVLLIISVLVPALGQAQGVAKDWDKHRHHISDVVTKGVNEIQTRLNSPIAKKYYESGVEWLSVEGPKVGQKVSAWTWERLMGAFGFFGYLLGLILVPIYLFFFLKESHVIKTTWSDYLPLRASQFKDEVVDTLKEVNQYLISFFRGQMVVSLIDGALVAIALEIIGLPYALLIGVFLAILGLIPYIGNALVMIPAVLIAIVHFSDTNEKFLPIDSKVVANQATIINGKKKVVAETSSVYRVTVLGDDDKILNGYVPMSLEPVETSEHSETAVETDLKSDTIAIGEVHEVFLDENRGSITRALRTIEGPAKRIEYLKNAWSFLPNMWFYPLIVLSIFFILQQINGLVTAPKIVGDSVGLHPLTVIFSVLFWSFLLGGLLGALLAVPMTASLKVLFRRYVWATRIEPKVGPLGEQVTDVDDPTEEESLPPA